MAELLTTGAAKPGDLALLIGYGAGLSYAAQVVRMPTVERALSLGVGRLLAHRLAAKPGLQLFAFLAPALTDYRKRRCRAVA